TFRSLKSGANTKPSCHHLKDSGALELNQFLEVEILEAVLARVFDEFGRDSLDLRADYGADRQILQSCGLQSLDVIRCHALHAHTDDLVALRIEAGGANVANVFGRHSLHTHADQLVGVAFESEVAHGFDVFGSYALDSHSDRAIGVHFEAGGAHFLDVLRGDALRFHSD